MGICQFWLQVNCAPLPIWSYISCPHCNLFPLLFTFNTFKQFPTFVFKSLLMISFSFLVDLMNYSGYGDLTF